MENIYADIAARTGGNIYIGVVGPVRTGKSTLIKRIMETLVIPCIEDPYRRERARDELPQSGSGKTIMTSEPKFIPEEAVEISPDGTAKLRVRFIDSVGYMIPGAVGADEDGAPRMVTTPWYDYEIPMTEAAELGTKKVTEEHCSIGLVVTTDGTVTDIPRGDYIEAEERAIRDMQRCGKPFLVVINSRTPGADSANVVSSWDVLSGKAAVSGHCAVIGGGLVGTETAEYLLEKGCTVSIIEMLDKIANGESSTILPTIMADFKQHDVKQYVNTKVSAIEPGCVKATQGENEITIPCDMVVMAVGSRKNVLDVDGVTVPVYYAGDCAGERTASIAEAIRGGYKAANEI